MKDTNSELSEADELSLEANVQDELANYEQQIRKYRAGEVDETKMQKLRLHFGTYAQRQEGVQMQRIKIPGGFMTACYRAGTSATEPFNVLPYTEALFRYLVRNKYNQNLGRKFKISFEGCAEDHSGLRIHDIGLWAVTKIENGVQRRGFRVYLGGGLGAAPHLAHLYTDFLPVDELFNLAAAALRLFDRYGERKARMKARMKFLVESLGWEAFCEALDEERERVGPVPLSSYLEETEEFIPETADDLHGNKRLKLLDPRTNDPQFQAWARDSVVDHKISGFRGVHVRIKLGDLTAARARGLAKVARQFSAGQLRISIEQNIYLPWVREDELSDLYAALGELSLAERGVGTIADVTTCPGSDTCRLGIASAKGLGSELGGVLGGVIGGTPGGGATGQKAHPMLAGLVGELARPLRIKVSGCPNGCAQHSVANIGFYAAALSQEDRSVPAYFVTLGGETSPESAQFGSLIGKFPAKNCVQLTETVLGLFEKERLPAEQFTTFANRIGTKRLKEILEPLRHVPSFETDPSFYEDYGHEHESFAVRRGIKGECAGSTVAETLPTIEAARERLAQAEALIYHKEYGDAGLAAYEAAAAAARVPLYQRLVDPFTAAEALWEFENLFVLSGETGGSWEGVSSLFEDLLSNVRHTSDVRHTSVSRDLTEDDPS